MWLRVVLAAQFVLAIHLAGAPHALGQTVTQRGFVDLRGTWYPQDAPGDSRNGVLDLRAREELFVRPMSWLRISAGVDAAANSYDQVDARWRLDWQDRSVRRPALSLRRLTGTVSRGGFSLDLGKQFIRWGKADIVTPTDRFAPRDYLNVLDADFLAVTGVRGAWAGGSETIEVVVLPRFTPSRMPLLDQRWTRVGPSIRLVDATNPSSLPRGTQTGLRWGHVGSGYEWSAAFFNGYNHLPNIDSSFATGLSAVAAVPSSQPVVSIPITRRYPAMRMWGGDAAVPTSWVTMKGEVAYFITSDPLADEYVLYVVQAERQTGEWTLIGGYAGTVVTDARMPGTFAPDRGTSRSFLGRASYTIDANRSAAVEAAIRQNGEGTYVKGEWSVGRGPHWRTTVSGAIIRGDLADFLGQFRRNSNVAVGLRYSF